MTAQNQMSVTSLLAAVEEILLNGGYKNVTDSVTKNIEGWNTSTTRLFEDEMSVVGVIVFETCASLLEGWADAQGALVNVISRHIGSDEAKAWDGYLVLLTPGIDSSLREALEAIRYNTQRVRKLVATGEDLRFLDDVERVLSCLLPLATSAKEPSETTVFDLLPDLLEQEGVSREVTAAIIEAFKDQAPLLERLYEKVRAK